MHHFQVDLVTHELSDVADTILDHRGPAWGQEGMKHSCIVCSIIEIKTNMHTAIMAKQRTESIIKELNLRQQCIHGLPLTLTLYIIYTERPCIL